MNTLSVRNELQTSKYCTEKLLVSCIDVDGTPLNDFTRVVTDLQQLQISTRQSGTFFILTCTCGDAGCAGFFRGILVQHTETTIEWSILDHPSRLRLIFDATAYRSAVERGIADAKEMLQREIPRPSIMPEPRHLDYPLQ